MRRVLLLAVLATCACIASAVASQQTPVAFRQSFDQLLQAAEKARNENHGDESILLFRRALSVKPDSEQALWYLGTLLYEKEEYSEARDVLRQFVTLRSDAGPAWALLGLCEFQVRAYPRALAHLQRAIAQGIGDRKELAQAVYYHEVILLIRFERYDDGMDLLQRMVSSGPPNSRLVEPAGLGGLRLPLLPAEIPPDSREIVDLAGHAVLAMETQRREEAESDFNRLVTAYPNEPGVHFLYGEYLAQLHPDKAASEFRRELKISPFHVLARVRLADVLIAEHDYDRALALARQAIKLDPKRASAHMLAGEALLAKGNAGDGIRELETARDNDPTIVRAHWDLLRAYMARGRKGDADREKQAIQELSERNSQGHQQYSGDIPRDRSAP